MMKRGSKIGIIVLILMLSIGFAAITTTLFINGSVGVYTDTNDWNVYFGSARVIGNGTAVIDETKTNISFSTDKLTTVGETVVLEYAVVNDSSLYDANVNVSFVLGEDTNNILEYLSITRDGFKEGIAKNIDAKSYEIGSITIKLIKPYSGPDASIDFTVTLDITAEDRTTQAVDNDDTISGYVYGPDGELLRNTPITIYKQNKVVTTDENGMYEVEIAQGKYSVAYLPGKTASELSDLGIAAGYDNTAYISSFDTYLSRDIHFKPERIGDIITLGSEEFYYIGDTPNNEMKLLAKNELGTYGDGNRQATSNYIQTPYIQKNRYLEDKDVAWENSDIKPYVDEYVTYLKTYRNDVVSGRLLYNYEFVDLVGDLIDMATISNLSSPTTFYNNKPWLNGDYFLMDIFEITFRSGYDSYQDFGVYYIKNNGRYISPARHTSVHRVRPVIIVRRS